MSDTPRTDQQAREWDDGFSMPSDLIALARDLERENAALRVELLEEALVNGKGSEREAKLLSIISRIRWVIDRELDWSQAQRLEKAGDLCDEVLGKEAQP